MIPTRLQCCRVIITIFIKPIPRIIVFKLVIELASKLRELNQHPIVSVEIRRTCQPMKVSQNHIVEVRIVPEMEMKLVAESKVSQFIPRD